MCAMLLLLLLLLPLLALPLHRHDWVCEWVGRQLDQPHRL
jgi:hypothetical protein